MPDIKSDEPSQLKLVTSALYVLVFLFICRIISMCFIPLNDSTEARYGEIARKMLETGNWVTLQHDYGVPFWAKPPLSTWLSALSMDVFGVNEFAVRLPGLLLSIGILWLVWDLAKKHSGSSAATVAVLVLASTLYFFLDAGTVMTDPSLLFCITLSLVAFWHAFVDESKLWSYVFFIGLGLGLLAKGPIAVVLVGMSLFFWILLRNQWVNLWNRLPWIKGTLILTSIALPWYLLAELRTPGFLNYFIIGEHISRFLTPGWTGDKYGMAHHAPMGMIWIYALAGLFPWSIWSVSWGIKSWKKIPFLFKDEDGWMSYLFLCMTVPLVFFTFASNIIYPYVFPSLPVFALFFSEVWNRSRVSLATSQWLLRCSLIPGLFFLIATLAFQVIPEIVAKTQKPIVNTWIKQHPAADNNLIYWDYGTNFSAQFYSAGKVSATKDIVVLCKFLSNNSDNYMVINSNEVTQIPAPIYAKGTIVKKVLFKNNLMLLIHFPVFSC